MATYTIKYLDGEIETVTASSVQYDPDASDYNFYCGSQGIALIPATNVRSVTRVETVKERSYPYQDGDVIVLGPEVFASADGEAISWKGSNYSRIPYPSLGAVTG